MSIEGKKKLFVIVGPTAVGKTALSIELAKKFNGEIINGDSQQVYRGFDIGTAKITTEEMEGVPHHLIDTRDASNPYNAFEFKNDVEDLVDEITSRGKLPILVGGTGLYVQSVLYDYDFPATQNNPALREELRQLSREALHEKLTELDREAAEKIHFNNTKRMIRAIEVCLTTGKKFSELSTADEKIENYDAFVVALDMPRDMLYERINKRVEIMIENGIEAEVRGLVEQGLSDTNAMTAIGYREFLPYFAGDSSLDTVIENIQQNSRRFAKRQLTWFRNKMDVNWFDVTKVDIEDITTLISDYVNR